ncbi:aminopeptidase P family protein [candidate division KSB1 bacterium]|nr:aminopeptidase P family protein [candidate division KSB1 bacterium]NIR73259.1 aminopeptidase P family protein [candidate division KSB1 bacterium]NIS26965.1 aminopeptidase P family protein [candidate division KSB1 bacterium]NIT73804.1 aminopeptidase P family protein [candidate division KSB1 bacterium]NIU27709.1 aminopeptidase P family protein [candidate division KSB1 bacterium]
MSLTNLTEIQEHLKDQGIDGWLLFDFHGQNYIATNFVGIEPDRILTRRWFYFIPQKGEPVLLVHKIERSNFPNPPKQTEFYVGWQELKNKLKPILNGKRKIAMEYSPGGAIPYVSCVDGGTLDVVREIGVEVVTSANLVQYFQGPWSEEQLQSHIYATENVHRIKDEVFALIGDKLKGQEKINEYEVQKFILERLEEANMVTEEPPIVAVNANASNPHYAPSPNRFSPIKQNDTVLIDLFGKEKTPNAVYADITWMGFAGESVPEEQRKIFDIVAQARDAGLDLLGQASEQGKTLQGWEVDRQVRKVITDAGYGDYFYHRTGHSLDTKIHGNSVNMDNLETQDQREIISGLGFTIEPGIYLEKFGVRSEINVYFSVDGPKVYGPIQKEMIAILK